jgi:prepilin-type N-terminal cleavage/methylation domain-containing protein/prepilin-type processing-associated H-X9-DG protein
MTETQSKDLAHDKNLHANSTSKNNPMKSSLSNSRDRRGFTMVEILVVILIIAVLAAVTFTGTRKLMDSAASTRTMSNYRQLAAIGQTFSSENNGWIIHEAKLQIDGENRNWWQHMLVTMSPDLASNANHKNSIGDNFGRSSGLFGDPKALKKAKNSLPTSGHNSYRTYAYNNRIGMYRPDEPGSMAWGTGVRFTYQVEVPNKLILFTHKILGGTSYSRLLQPEDFSKGEVYFDLHGGSALVGFYDGHVEKFTKFNFPAKGGKNPNTGQPYTTKETTEYWFGSATTLPPL